MDALLKTLIRRSFAANGLRNLIAALAIALTAVLFTSVSTLVAGTMESLQLTAQIQKMSRSDGDFRYMTEEQFLALREADLIKEAGLRMPVGFLTNTSRHNIEFDVLDEIQADLTFCTPTHGRSPQEAHEIVMSDKALKDLGAQPETGTKIPLTFIAHGKEYSLSMTVCGWYEALNDQLSVAWAGTAFRDAYPDIFQYTYDQDRDMAGTYWSDITAKSRVNLAKRMEELSRSLGGDPDHMDAPNHLPAVVNQQTNPAPNLPQIALAALLLALFLFCGYLLIYNVFDIAVMQEIRRYGLYRTIGMSRRQVRQLINRQALEVYLAGTPAGLLLGFFIGRAALPYIMGTLSTEYDYLAMDVSPSPLIFLWAALLTALTVFFSTRKPVRTAANIPPVEAFRYVESSAGRRTLRRSALGANLFRLAWSNLGRNRRRTAFIMLSLLLCTSLLNCAGTAADSVDVEKQTAYMIRTDFGVVNAVSTSNLKGFTSREQALKKETIEAIASQPGITEGAPVYRNTREDVNVTFDYGHPLTGQHFFMEQSGLDFLVDPEGRTLGLGSDGYPLCNVYGMEETAIARMDLREGETNAHILYKKMLRGEGILAGVGVIRKDMSLNPLLDQVDVGQTVTIRKNGQIVLELPVLAKAAVNGDDMEIGFTTNSIIEIGGDSVCFYLPSSLFCSLYDQPSVYKYSFNVEDEYQEAMTVFLDDYMEQVDPDINYLSAQEARESARSTQRMIRFVGGTIGLILGIAGILNLINTMITTILTRRREFAAMQSIGMTGRQLRTMMVLEGLYYAAGACTAGLTLSVILNLTLIKGLIQGVWFCTFHFTLVPAATVSAILLLLSAVIPVVVLKVFHRGSIVEQLRVAE